MRLSSNLLAWPRRAIAAEWQGPPDLPRSLMVGWRLIAVRWVGALAVGPSLPLMHLLANRPVAAYVILFGALIYNATIRSYMQRRPEMFASGYVTTICDSILNISMVLVGGG